MLARFVLREFLKELAEIAAVAAVETVAVRVAQNFIDRNFPSEPKKPCKKSRRRSK